MRTVLTSKIDGLDTIDGFGDGVSDPEATKKKLVDIIPQTDEAIALSAKKNEINQIWALVRETKVAANAPGLSLSEKRVEYEKYKTHMAEIDVKSDELIPLHKALEKKIEELRVSEAVYFEPKLGEFLETSLPMVDDVMVKVSDLKDKYPIPDGKLLALDGTLVDDLRGVIYWENKTEWVATQILQIGVTIPTGGIRQDDLTAAQIDEIELQFESLRVSKLSASEKLEEKKSALERAAIEATRLFNQYTIQDTADPLGESQEWLATETDSIEVKYA